MELKREHWTQEDYDKFREYLKSVSDEKYLKFHSGLVPEVDEIYGVRVPIIRKTAKEILKGNYTEFLACNQGNYSEERITEGLVLAAIKCGYEEMLENMKRFSKRINSWAVCDTVSFKGLKNYRENIFKDIDWFVKNENPWIVRFGLGILMGFFLDYEYIERVLQITEDIKSDFYYIEMMQGWLIATAAAKCRDKTFEFLENNMLSKKVMKITVRKMCESFRISKEDKERARQIIKGAK